MMTSILQQFRQNAAGNMVTVLALALPVLLVGAGGAIDYASWTHQRSNLQAAADAGALGATRELTLPGRTETQIRAVATTLAQTVLHRDGEQAGVTVTSQMSGTNGVNVVVSQPGASRFLGLLGIEAPMIEASATGRVSSTGRPCVIILDETAAAAAYLKSNANLAANGCTFHTNSRHSQAVTSDSGITLSATLICSSGGFSGQGSFLGAKTSDCPQMPDPLASRPAPFVPGGCDFTNHRVELNNSAASRHVLSPGVYCGGLFIGANSFVSFNPGTYVIKDGPLALDSNADVRGQYVSFYLTGLASVLNFTSNSKVFLDAPRDGAMAGILFFEDRSAPLLREHRITSNFASNMTGTVYFPRGRFIVDASNEVSRQSAYTVIVARQLELNASPRLVLNANYHLTDVPLPAAIANSDKVRLER